LSKHFKFEQFLAQILLRDRQSKDGLLSNPTQCFCTSQNRQTLTWHLIGGCADVSPTDVSPTNFLILTSSLFKPLGVPDERVMSFLLILLSFSVVKLPDQYAQECLF